MHFSGIVFRRTALHRTGPRKIALRGAALRVGVAVIAAAALALSGCAGFMGSSSTKDTGVTLEYRMSEGSSYSYRMANDTVQTMEVQGQSIPIESTEVLEFTAETLGVESGTRSLEITIDDLSVSATSPQGSGDADVTGVVGESFEMTLTALGYEGGLPESDALQYTMEPQGPRSVIPTFEAMFPDLPDHPVDIGGTWPAVLEVVEESGDTEVRITIDAVNTLVGFETYEGHECAKITATLTGTIEGGGTQQGVEWVMDSDMVGTGLWYFAHKEGLLIDDTTEGTADGTITVLAPTGEMVMPVTREFTMTTELVE